MNVTKTTLKWTAALRSGQYEQAEGRLRKTDLDNEEKKSFCCLGVACDIVAPRQWNNLDEHGQNQGLPGDYVLTRIGLSEDEAAVLAGVNDQCHASFDKIADIIEHQLIEIVPSDKSGSVSRNDSAIATMGKYWEYNRKVRGHAQD